MVIYDIKLENILHKGTFIGIDEFGCAILKNNNTLLKVTDGRMRKEAIESKPKQFKKAL